MTFLETLTYFRILETILESMFIKIVGP